ncbi:hypothetical protein AVEN_251703-1 [Araneus ventricosus]|uniref:Uncharacterized protein n=1 Tax=Araneus ventricosus TaxID=182803 RepID=A0A4Y2NBI6_ARAVE|nr:hypothetical protein AVEN_251703-1 [Araneus ventricosus]
MKITFPTKTNGSSFRRRDSEFKLNTTFKQRGMKKKSKENSNRCFPSGHLSSSSPATNPAGSNMRPRIFIQLFQRYIHPNPLREQKQYNSYPSSKFVLHNQISFIEVERDSGAKAIYADGSKTNEGT